MIKTGDIMKPLKGKISLTIDDPVLEAIKVLAEENDRSVSSYINLVLREHLKEMERKRAENQENPLDRGVKTGIK